MQKVENIGNREPGTKIRAIQTRFKGYHFRSRLEARWAVLFGHMGWSWKYEHQGYHVGWSEQDRKRWLPDFEVQALADPVVGARWTNFYVEVKGGAFDWCDFFSRFDFDGGPDGFQNSGDPYWPGDRSDLRPVLVLGDVPEPRVGLLKAWLVTHHEGVAAEEVAIRPDGLFRMPDMGSSWDGFFFPTTGRLDVGQFDDRLGELTWLERTCGHFPKIYDAVGAARSARFEHGECI